jgi:DNA replication protein DnaC
VLFATASQWVDKLADAHTSGRLQAELLRLSRYPLLVVDEVGYIPFEPDRRTCSSNSSHPDMSGPA